MTDFYFILNRHLAHKFAAVPGSSIFLNKLAGSATPAIGIEFVVVPSEETAIGPSGTTAYCFVPFSHKNLVL